MIRYKKKDLGTNNINTIKGKLTLMYHIGEYGYCTENSQKNKLQILKNNPLSEQQCDVREIY